MPMTFKLKKKRGGAGDAPTNTHNSKKNLNAKTFIAKSFYEKAKQALQLHGVTTEAAFQALQQITDEEVNKKNWEDWESEENTPRTSMSSVDDDSQSLATNPSGLSENFIESTKKIFDDPTLSQTSIDEQKLRTILTTAYEDTLNAYEDTVRRQSMNSLRRFNSVTVSPSNVYPSTTNDTGIANINLSNTETVDSSFLTTTANSGVQPNANSGVKPNANSGVQPNASNNPKFGSITSFKPLEITNNVTKTSTGLNTDASYIGKIYNFGQHNPALNTGNSGYSLDFNDLFANLDLENVKSNLRSVQLSANTYVSTFFPGSNTNNFPYKFDVKLADNNEFGKIKTNVKAILQSVRKVHEQLINQLIDDNNANVETMSNELQKIISAIGTVVIILSRVYVCVVVSEYLTQKSPSAKSRIEDKKKKIDKLTTLLKDTIPLLLKLENQNNHINI